MSRGARFIFGLDGTRKYRLEELEDGGCFVAASDRKFAVSFFQNPLKTRQISKWWKLPKKRKYMQNIYIEKLWICLQYYSFYHCLKNSSRHFAKPVKN